MNKNIKGQIKKWISVKLGVLLRNRSTVYYCEKPRC